MLQKFNKMNTILDLKETNKQIFKNKERMIKLKVKRRISRIKK